MSVITGVFVSIAGSLGAPPRFVASAVVVALYLGLCGFVYVRHQRGRSVADIDRQVVASDSGETTLVAFASQTGFAEELARQTAARLREAGQAVSLLPFEQVDHAALRTTSRALFVVSTTGEGDAPFSAARFQRVAMMERQSLDGLRYGVLALGDRSYTQYCAFGFALDEWLRARAAVPLFDVIDVNDGDVSAISRWKKSVSALCGDQAAGGWSERSFSRWRLVERRVLNEGSPGAPAYHIGLEAVASPADWQAGDIAEIVPGFLTAHDPVQGAVTREYSIASLPSDGRLELLVRQVRRPDGELGLGSGWLTTHIPCGGEVWLRVRTNSAFHAPDPLRPLVLIGNGTGLAGLRAHLKARACIGQPANWLMFGERTRHHDVFHREEIEDWLARGVLARFDMACSRDQAERVYVQDLVRCAADDLRRWVAEGAAIYVCGSRIGMSAGVHAALVTVLGAAGVEQLIEEGRYRCDVY